MQIYNFNSSIFSAENCILSLFFFMTFISSFAICLIYSLLFDRINAVDFLQSKFIVGCRQNIDFSNGWIYGICWTQKCLNFRSLKILYTFGWIVHAIREKVQSKNNRHIIHTSKPLCPNWRKNPIQNELFREIFFRSFLLRKHALLDGIHICFSGLCIIVKSCFSRLLLSIYLYFVEAPLPGPMKNPESSELIRWWHLRWS